MSITVRMSDKEKQIVLSYAKNEGMSLSEVVRRAIFDAIEDKYDSIIGDGAFEEYERDPDGMRWEDFEKELGGNK